MSAVLTAVMVIGIAANVVGALCVVVPCLAVAAAVSWAIVISDSRP